MNMRRRRRRIGAPDHHAGRAVDGARVEAARRFPVHQLQGDVPSLVAHGVRIDLGRADGVEESHGKAAGDQRAGSGVMGLQNRSAAVAGADRVETMCDVAERLIPAHRLEAALAFRSGPPQWARQARRRIAPDPVIANRAFAAESAPADIVVGIANHIDRAVRRRLHQHAAGVVAITRAGCADRGEARHRSSPKDEAVYKLGPVPPVPIREMRSAAV